jgi:hypothetical protein
MIGMSLASILMLVGGILLSEICPAVLDVARACCGSPANTKASAAAAANVLRTTARDAPAKIDND